MTEGEHQAAPCWPDSAAVNGNGVHQLAGDGLVAFQDGQMRGGADQV
jgi:hypothetical protein